MEPGDDFARMHLAAIVESSDDAIISLTLDGIIQTWNAGAERLFGYTATEAVGRPASILIPQDRGDEQAVILDRIRRGERIEHYETVRRRKDGTYVNISDTFSPIRNDAGQIIGASKIARDIGGRLRSDAAVSHLAAIVSSSEDAIVGKTLDGIVESWNAAAERLLGYTAEEVIGRSIMLIIPPERVQEEEDILTRIRRGERIEHFETVRVAKGGRQIDVELTISPVLDAAGRVIGSSKFMRDITARRREEKEREELLAREQHARAEADAANRAKDEFLTTLSHELRTPLNAILGWAQTLGARLHDRAIVERAVETIIRNAKQQAHLIEDLLDLSSIVSGRFRLNLRPVELVSVLTAALETVRPAVQAKEIQVDTHFDPSVGPVWGDPDRLQQVFWNLLSNAVKFTPRSGRVDVRLEHTRSRAVVKVTDSGIGIAPEVLPAVFDRFRQADSSITRTHGGLGLGLAIVRQLVELHGGTVEASSPGEGQGATFTVIIPLMAVRVGAVPPVMAGIELGRCDGISVLVVDDEPDGRDLLRLVLEQCGATVTAVESAAEALRVLERLTPHVLISDLAMPGVDGYALIRQARARSATAHVPAVALTAYASAEARVLAFSAGFDAYIAKPVDPAELVAIVVRHARRSQTLEPPDGGR
jgi:PAS domain S-box-containing protein